MNVRNTFQLTKTFVFIKLIQIDKFTINTDHSAGSESSKHNIHQLQSSYRNQ